MVDEVWWNRLVDGAVGVAARKDVPNEEERLRFDHHHSCGPRSAESDMVFVVRRIWGGT